MAVLPMSPLGANTGWGAAFTWRIIVTPGYIFLR